MISGDGPAQYSTEVRVELDTDRPDKPTNYSKTTGNYCEDKISSKQPTMVKRLAWRFIAAQIAITSAARAETRVL